MGYQKNLSFHRYSFQKCEVDLSKKCTKTKFCQKTVLPSEKLAKSQKNRIWAKTFLDALLLRRKCTVHFLYQYKKTDFLIPHSTYSPKNNNRFHLIEKLMCSFYEIKSPKCKQTPNIS